MVEATKIVGSLMYGEEGSISILAQLIDLSIVAAAKLQNSSILKEEDCETKTQSLLMAL